MEETGQTGYNTCTGPYEYIIYRAEGITGTDYMMIKSIPTTTLNDTVYVDTPLNTLTTGYIYRIEVWNRTRK